VAQAVSEFFLGCSQEGGKRYSLKCSQEGGKRYSLRCSQEGGKRTKHSSSLGVNERAPATLQPSGMLDVVEC